MIEIKFIPDAGVCNLCRELNIEYKTGMKVYAAAQGNEKIGQCGFYIEGDKGVLSFTAMNGGGLEPIEDGLLRASLSYMYENGAANALCGGGVPGKMLKRLGFKENNGVFLLDLAHSFLTSGCQGKQ